MVLLPQLANLKGFLESKLALILQFLQGAGGSSRHSVRNGQLPYMTISDVTHDQLDCLFIGKAGLDISLYVDAIICNHILSRCSTIIDYARNRIMLLHDDL